MGNFWLDLEAEEQYVRAMASAVQPGEVLLTTSEEGRLLARHGWALLRENNLLAWVRRPASAPNGITA